MTSSSERMASRDWERSASTAVMFGDILENKGTFSVVVMEISCDSSEDKQGLRHFTLMASTERRSREIDWYGMAPVPLNSCGDSPLTSKPSREFSNFLRPSLLSRTRHHLSPCEVVQQAPQNWRLLGIGCTFCIGGFKR